MRVLRQSIARTIMVFLTSSADHVSGVAAATLTITASKAGAAFASITPVVTDRGNGWYSIALTATDTNTLGDLVIRATAAGADPIDTLMQVVSYNFEDAVRLGLTSLPNAAAAAAGGLFTRGTGAGQINQTTNGRIDVDVLSLAAAAITNLLDATYEGSRTIRGFFRVARAALVNKAIDLTTAPKFRDDADAKDRISFAMSGGNAIRTPTVDET